MKRLFKKHYWKGYFDGFDHGVSSGINAANYLTLLDLKRIGSTGDNFEAKWEDVLALFPAETVEKIQAKDVYF
jgi:hypothetical protein